MFRINKVDLHDLTERLAGLEVEHTRTTEKVRVDSVVDSPSWDWPYYAYKLFDGRIVDPLEWVIHKPAS